MYSQLILGNEYLHRPGNIERFFSLLLAMFLLAATVAMRRWGLARPGRRSAHFSTRKSSARGWPQTWEGSYRRILKLSTRIGRVTGDDSASPSGEGSVLTWTAVILPSRGLSRGLSGHRLCAHVTVKPYARVGWVRSTAAKCSSGATLPRYAESPSAALACSTPVGDNLARGSGRRGRRFKSCHPDQRRRSLNCANAAPRCLLSTPAPQQTPRRGRKEHEGNPRESRGRLRQAEEHAASRVVRNAAMSGQTQTAPSTPLAADRRT